MRTGENLVDCDQKGNRDGSELLCEHHNSREWWALRATLRGMRSEVLTDARCHYCHNLKPRSVGGLAL